MSSKMIVTVALAGMSLILATGCSHSAKKKSAEKISETKINAPEVMGTQFTTIVFDKDKSNLSQPNRELIKELANRAHASKKKIEEIRILAWSDKEYPEKVQGKSKKSDIELADNRASKIKKYLEEELKEMDDVEAYNMAKRPNLLSKMFRDEDFHVKESFETSGMSASKLPDGSVSFTKASKALVIIDYEGDEDNLK